MVFCDKGDTDSLKAVIGKLNVAWEAWHPNGEALLAAGAAAKKLKDAALAQRLFDRALADFNRETGSDVSPDLAGGFHDGLGINAMSWSASGDRLAASDGGDVVIIDTKTYREIDRLHHREWVRGVAYCGDRIASAAMHNVYLWDPAL